MAQQSEPDRASISTIFMRLAGAAVIFAAARSWFQDERVVEKVVHEHAEKVHAPQSAASEPGRGRSAETPSEIPWLGWKDIAWRVYQEMIDDRLLLVAAGVTFYSILALFPAIAALVSLYGLFADPSTVRDHIATLSFFLPAGALDIIGGQAQRIAAKGSNTLGTTFLISFAIALWSANAGVKAMFDGLNVVYDEKEKRSIVMLNVESLLFTFAGLLFIVLALTSVVVLPAMFNFIGLGPTLEILLSVGRWPLLLAAVILGLAVLYRYGPSREHAEWRWVTWGSAVAAVLWVAVSVLFSWYVSNIGNYNETYGSLGAAIGFMTWMWLSIAVTLVGAEINAEMEHQTACDSTVGEKKPMGSRGATVADTLGVSQPD